MRKLRAALLCGLAALPLAACAGASTTALNAPSASGTAGIALPDGAVEQVAYDMPSAPAAVLVFLPGPALPAAPDLPSLIPTLGDPLAGLPPALWADEQVGVMMPRTLLAAAEQAQEAMHSLLKLAREEARVPVWVAGDAPAVAAALDSAAPGAIAGVVVTSVASGAGECRESVTFSRGGLGMVPRISVRRSGSACGSESAPAALPMPPAGLPAEPPSAPPTLMVREQGALPGHGDVIAPETLPAARPLVRRIADWMKAPAG